MENTQTIIESGDQAQIALLTKNEVVGDLLYATIYSYLTLNDVQDQIQSKSSGIVNYRLPSYGLFGARLQTAYWFGLPRNVNFSGLLMDVDHLAVQNAAEDNDHQKVLGFMQSSGNRASAMEHLVPEQIFSTEDNPAQGISAVKALSLANAEGQRIWRIDQNNLNEALAAINLGSEIENEIRNAVLAGKIATAHEQPINFASGTNIGYLLIDPETGAGAYLISGGSNGGILILAVFAFMAAMIIFSLFTGGLGIFAAGLIGLAYVEFANNIKVAVATAKNNAQLNAMVIDAAVIALGKTFLSLLGPLAKSLGPELQALKTFMSGIFTIWSLAEFCSTFFC